MKKVKKEDLSNVLYMHEVGENVKAVIDFCKESHRLTKKWHRLKGNTIKFRKPFPVRSIELSENELILFKKLWNNEK